MTTARRFMIVLVVLLVTLSAGGFALAQTDGPDPDSPIKLETPDATEDVAPEDEEDDVDGTPDAGPNLEATPISSGDVQLAAMTLDSNDLPEDWHLIQESYTSPEDLISGLSGLIDADDLAATGLLNFYDSYYVNPADLNTVRTYAIEFETVEGAAAGFALLEDEDLTVPNGSFEDLPGLDGIGDGPSEISSGTISNGDGTTTNSYDVSFTIGQYELGAAMETYDGSEPDQELVEQMARDLAARAETLLAGGDVPGIIDTLPSQVVKLDSVISFEGYQTAAEAFLIADPDDAPAGYLSGYATGASFSTSLTSALPYVTIGITSFESDSDVEDALGSPDSIMPLFDELEEIDIDPLDGADEVLAYSFASVEGEGDPDSVRIFVQIDDQLVTIDVQGEEDVDTARQVAEEWTESQIACMLDGECGPADAEG
jgi:hypothetical protein